MTTWTEDKIKLLATLFTEGWSRGQIAAKLEVSRNAICGKIDRLGVDLAKFVTSTSGLDRPPRTYKPQRVGRPTKQDRQAWRPPVSHPAAGVAVAAEEPPPASPLAGAIVLMHLRHNTCRWPVNDGRPEYLFCGAHCDPGPYCAEHARRAYNPTKPRTL
jgi:GcrA cell cycle regulator